MRSSYLCSAVRSSRSTQVDCPTARSRGPSGKTRLRFARRDGSAGVRTWSLRSAMAGLVWGTSTELGPVKMTFSVLAVAKWHKSRLRMTWETMHQRPGNEIKGCMMPRQ